ncbi:MAG: PepSY domain-containing protein [Bacteroides sp.]|nr:PepSY domain-containing protein [Roseburia sp.]MCM1346465.1 PepSY domain-containing protein [Bacteroides sp.]MCM1420334.1 PepSY domain-containing protein [Bacteroides sp.]
MKFSKFTLGVHRITGTIISLFFFLWFATGLVLIYHSYPRLPEKTNNALKETLPDSLPNLNTFTAMAGDTLRSLSVRQFLGQTLVKVSSTDTSFTACTDTQQEVRNVTFADAERIARLWINAPIERVDTLHERTQWVMYERYERAMPIYKFTFADKERHEFFISGKTGAAQQLTDRNQRMWAWLGAIPHKLYFTGVRCNLDLWKTCITTGGIFCLLAALSGWGLGIYMQVKNRRKTGVWRNPFKKASYKWHHLLGLIFGLFLICWGISGSLAMQRVPKWLVPYDSEYTMYAPDVWNDGSLDLQSFKLDYTTLKAAYPALKEVEWTSIGEKPVYRIIADSTELFIDASTTEVQPLEVTAEAVMSRMHKLYGEEIPITLERMERYDEYYLSANGRLRLPVYKVVVADKDGSRLYIGVHDDYVRFFNRNKMARKWMFSAMHYLNIKYLVERPVLWHTCIWVLCLGGACVSFTGFLLGIKYLHRMFGKKKK